MAHNPVDVAEMIMGLCTGTPTATKVQKLTYYAHVIHRARRQEPLVTGGFQAWTNGPVSRAVYNRQRGNFAPPTVNGDPALIDEDAAESVRLAVGLYGDMTERELVNLSHGDGPWTLARGPIPSSERSTAKIDDELIDAVLVPVISDLLDDIESPGLSLDEFQSRFALT